MSRRRNESKGSVLGVLFLVWLVVKLFWFIVAVAAGTAVFFVVRAVIRREQAAALARARAAAAIAARAEQQHEWVLRGDDRGIYGAEGARLMDYIDGGVRKEIARRSDL